MTDISPLQRREGDVLYEVVAHRLESLIEAGTLQPGDRLPSVRKLKSQLSISSSTVLEAYRLLEDRGLIEAKPRSGYFVKLHLRRLPEEPTATQPHRQIYGVDLSLAMRLNAALGRNPQGLQLGAAVPSPKLLPITALNRITARLLRDQPELAHSYGSALGRPELRHEIARRLLDAGCSVTPDEIVVTNGAMEAVYLCLQAATQPGDVVAVESPTYFGLFEALAALHLQVLELPTDPREGICLDTLKKALQQKQIAACLLVSNFSNPLGSLMSAVKKQQLVALMSHHQIPIIEDDIYGELQFEGPRPPALKAFDLQGWVMYCSSFSKTLSPGLRVGWASPGRFQIQVEQGKMATNFATAIIPQLTVATFLQNGGYDRHLRRLRSAYRTQTLQMIQSVGEAFPSGTKVSRPLGGHVLWVELPEYIDTLDLYELACRQDIYIAPGAMFSQSGHSRHGFRLNCGHPRSRELDVAVSQLGELAQKLLIESGMSYHRSSFRSADI
ncbi:MAG: PLP-dependent aminotransferase family protein [Phormidium sp. PBR-2020]|nr:MAG: PLP-dependent aminotransferase family protein [Phormidium sp. PBR-2020]